MNGWKVLSPILLIVGLTGGFFGRGYYDALTESQPPMVGDHFKASVVSVYDADTMTLEVDGTNYKSRLWGIDALERSQRCLSEEKTEPVKCGLIARDQFREIVLEKTVNCELKAMDDNRDRLVVRCLLNDKDPISELVRLGWAFSDTKYANDPYRNEENQAKENKAGVWNMRYMNPAEWRACQAYNRGGSTPPELCYKPLGPINKPQKSSSEL